MKENIKNIDFYYFSGTGNTLLVVKKMKEVFEDNGITVTLFPIEKSDPSQVNLQHVIGLAFPVAVQGTYPFVWDFIKSLPQTENTKIFMVDTLQKFSGGVVGNIKKIVKNKGCEPIGAKEIKMSNNFLPESIDEDKIDEIIRKGQEEAAEFAQDILHNRAEWKRVPVISDIFSFFSKKNFIWNMMRKAGSWQLDEEKCIKCYLCERMCPIHNIKMNEYPEFLGKCTFCMRCISFCPQRAIFLPDKDFVQYRAVKAEELLEKH
ncbi:MAG: EFR1 family ferrodoxin [Candidatus Cloacimonetes bacterium]|nr:EFR1 family ferrodoxin [Candidatus Cloacimonadota bacterium]MBS3766883.1 EFR1 family ferrodoxin [Candidatus Cloacimonadota bacterium]